MKKAGYVIEYDKHKKVFAEEDVFTETVDYLNNQGNPVEMAYWIELDEEEQAGIQIINKSSYGYRVDYGKADGDPESAQWVFSSPADISATIKSIWEQGFRTWGFTWRCPVLDSFKWVDIEMHNLYHNGFAMPWETDELKSLCEKLQQRDESQKGFVDMIAEKTANYKIITGTACKQLIENMKEILNHYGNNEQEEENNG